MKDLEHIVQKRLSDCAIDRVYDQVWEILDTKIKIITGNLMGVDIAISDLDVHSDDQPLMALEIARMYRSREWKVDITDGYLHFRARYQ